MLLIVRFVFRIGCNLSAELLRFIFIASSLSETFAIPSYGTLIHGKRKFGGPPEEMADPTHARKAVVHRIQSTNSGGAMIQSSPTKNSRRTACHLPAIQTKTGLYKSKSVPLVVESLTFTDDNQDLSENWPFEVPQSAPPVMKPEPVFVWSSPENPPQDVTFCKWSSRHQDGDCSIRMASGDKQRRSERAGNPYHDKFGAQNSADGATTTEGHTKWSRKPPHHLPPLDPSVFETKSKSVKAVSSREKKIKRCVNGPTEMESSRKMSSQKDSKNANRTENGFRIPAEKNDLSHKQSSVTSHSIKQNSRPLYMYHSVVSENDDLPFRGMSQRAQNIVPVKYEPRALRPSISISSSIEHLLSKETGVDARAGTSKGFSIQKSRASGPSLRSTASLLLKPGTTSSGKSSNGLLIRRKVEVNAPGITTYECDQAANSSTTRGENSNVPPFQVTPAIPTEFQSAGNAAEESLVVGELPKRDPRPGASSLSSCAYWRERKVGMCSDQSATEGENRTHARVLLKKFGTLDIKEN